MIQLQSTGFSDILRSWKKWKTKLLDKTKKKKKIMNKNQIKVLSGNEM